MFKILIDARMINHSGIGRYLQNILSGIIRHFGNVVLLGDVDLLNRYDVPVISFDNPIYSVSEQLKFRGIIPECDLFFSPHYNVPLLPVGAKRRIATVHDVFHLAFHRDLSVFQNIYAKRVINAALKKSDGIVTVSEFSKNEILKYTDMKYAGKISLIYNGVASAEKPSRKNNIDKFYFLFVGNIKPHKNLKRAVEAYRRLLLSDVGKRNPDFVIAGKKEGFITGDNDIVALIENDDLLRDRIRFTGGISDDELNALYSNALSLVFPSYYEGFGLPPLEAMSLDCPVLASNAACIPEICGDAVLYFNPYDVEDIFEKMKRIVEDDNLGKELIRKGRRRAQKFSWTTSVEKHVELFETCLNDV